MTGAVEATEPSDFPPLEQAARERLYDLLNEAADMEIALRRLLETKNPESCQEALMELLRALDRRTCKAMNIVTGGSEDD